MSKATNFYQPPSQIRDRLWSRELRNLWPNYTRIKLDRETGFQAYVDRFDWCKKQPSKFWVNGTGNVWYFENRSIAVLFKLTFGGAQ